MVDNPRSVLSLLVPFPLDDVGTRVVGITDGFYIESLSGVTPFNSHANSMLFPDIYPPLNLIASKVSIPLSNDDVENTSNGANKFSDRDGEKYFRYVGLPLPENLSDEESVETFCRESFNNILLFSWWLLGQQGC
ncbi:hypothetical protein Tco_0865361 [Tanacetum coccineum]